MDKCTQNSANSCKNSTENNVKAYILETVNDCIRMYHKRSSTHFYVYCEEQIITLLPVARILKSSEGRHLADKLETTLHLLQTSQPVTEIDLGAE